MESSNHSCCHSSGADSGVRQTLMEMEFERGIWYAAQTNDTERVHYLLGKGVEPDAEDAAGYTALHYAARNGHEKICQILLRRGANVNAATRCGRATALHRAVTQEHIRVVKLLIDSGADVNVKDSDNLSPLDRANKTNNSEICELLIAKGAVIT